MKEVKDYPKEGQFVAIWEYDNKIWAEEFKWKNGVLRTYNEKEEKFSGKKVRPIEYPWGYDEYCKKKFFVIK